LPQYLKLEGGPTLILFLFLFVTDLLVSLILFMFRLYGVMCCGFTRSEVVGLVCNFSGKLLLGAFLDTSSSFFYSRLAWRYLMKKFFPLYSNNKYLCVVLFFLTDGSCKFDSVEVPEQSLKQLERKESRVPNS
jgi:hypothetical protein